MRLQTLLVPQSRINAYHTIESLIYSTLMLAAIALEMHCLKGDIGVMLFFESHWLRRLSGLSVYNLLLIILIGLLLSGNRFYSLIRHRLMEQIIARSMLQDDLMRSWIQPVFASAFNSQGDGCSGDLLQALKRVLFCFWEKVQGSINTLSYQTHIIPRIARFILDYPGTILMQDRAPSHQAITTIEELHQQGITTLKWPPYSPDLNPIETVWNIMKDWIQHQYGHIDNITSYPQLRRVVQEAWDAVPNEHICKLIKSMPARCQAVINSNGGNTIYSVLVS